MNATAANATPELTNAFYQGHRAVMAARHALAIVVESDRDGRTKEHGGELARHIETCIAEFAALLADFGLELAEVLPAKTCNVCSREAVEYRRDADTRIVCNLCMRDRLEEVRDFTAAEVKEGAPSTPAMSRLAVLNAALDAVHHRGDQHGAPGVTFARIAAIWNILMGDDRFSAVDVALLLTALKLVRASVNPGHADNWTDMAGYAACGGEVAGAVAP